MAIYQKGDVAWVRQFWNNPDGSTDSKIRPGVVYDVIGEDHYCLLLFGKDKTGKVPGFKVFANSPEGKSMKLDKDSFISMEHFVRLPKFGMVRLKGVCPEGLMEKIEDYIDDNRIERPLN